MFIFIGVNIGMIFDLSRGGGYVAIFAREGKVAKNGRNSSLPHNHPKDYDNNRSGAYSSV